MKKIKKQKGFTLIELLVVIAIIGLLSTLATVAFNGARTKARNAKRLADVKQVQTALELYYNTNSSYATTTEITTVVTAVGTVLSGSIDTFMTNLPTSPLPYTDTPCTATSSPYRYESADGSTYTIKFCISEAVGNLTAGNITAHPGGVNND